MRRLLAIILAAVLTAMLTAGCTATGPADPGADSPAGGPAGRTDDGTGDGTSDPTGDGTGDPTPSYRDLVTDAGPLGYWPLDGEAKDVGPGRLGGRVRGGARWVAAAPGASRGGALALDGRTGHLYVADADSAAAEVLAPAQALTVELWVRPDGPVAQTGTLARWRWFGWGVSLTSGRATAALWVDAGERQVLLEGPRLDRSWHHVAVTSDGRVARLFVDGVQVARRRSGELFYRAIDPASDCCGRGGGVAFGRDGDAAAAHLEGLLDEVAVYDRALAAAEVARHHRAGSGD